MNQPVRVKILDHEYLVRSDEDEDQVRRVAQFVDGRLKEIRSQTQGLSETRLAILAAFHIAGEYFQALKDRDELNKEVQKRVRTLNLQIDSIRAQFGKLPEREPSQDRQDKRVGPQGF